jgi:hypothetical protein
MNSFSFDTPEHEVWIAVEVLKNKGYHVTEPVFMAKDPEGRDVHQVYVNGVKKYYTPGEGWWR